MTERINLEKYLNKNKQKKIILKHKLKKKTDGSVKFDKRI